MRKRPFAIYLRSQESDIATNFAPKICVFPEKKGSAVCAGPLNPSKMVSQEKFTYVYSYLSQDKCHAEKGARCVYLIQIDGAQKLSFM